jgi:hypothetical protein
MDFSANMLAMERLRKYHATVKLSDKVKIWAI